MEVAVVSFSYMVMTQFNFGPQSPLRTPFLDAIFPYTLIASIVAALAALTGLVITTWFSWRRDRREEDAASLDSKKKKLEIKKLERELSPRKRR
jgi:hypothetical protein